MIPLELRYGIEHAEHVSISQPWMERQREEIRRCRRCRRATVVAASAECRLVVKGARIVDQCLAAGVSLMLLQFVTDVRSDWKQMVDVARIPFRRHADDAGERLPVHPRERATALGCGRQVNEPHP